MDVTIARLLAVVAFASMMGCDETPKPTAVEAGKPLPSGKSGLPAKGPICERPSKCPNAPPLKPDEISACKHAILEPVCSRDAFAYKECALESETCDDAGAPVLAPASACNALLQKWNECLTKKPQALASASVALGLVPSASVAPSASASAPASH